MTTLLALVAAVLFGTGTYLLLSRELSRVLIGLALVAHGANALLVLSARGPGEPTIDSGAPLPGGAGSAGAAEFLDPLPQAFALTAIVITFGVSCFLLAMAYRSWILTRDDIVEDDREDRRIASAQE